MLFFLRRFDSGRLTDLPHDLSLQFQSGCYAGVEFLDVRAERALTLQICDRDALLDRRPHKRLIIDDGEPDFPAERLMHVGSTDVPRESLLVAINDDADVQIVEALGREQVKLALGAVKTGDSQ